MKSPAGKTVRFSEVVGHCGRPEPYTAWLDPKRDPRFQAAWREGRVLSVKQNTGGRKDVGEVGYVREPGSAYFIFPRTLKPFAGKRIVGIQYDLIRASTRLGRMAAPVRRAKAVQPRPPKHYEVTVRVVAIMHITDTVEAESLHEAKETALREAELRTVKVSEGKIVRRVVKVKRV